jgi:FkbM family methyltransferase
MYSFSQNFEDVYIHRAFSDVENGFYIDAGAFDPVVDSITKMLYDLGWSGINIEPGPSFVNFKSRVRDINLPYALTATDGEVVFHYNEADPGTSTTALSNVSNDDQTVRSYTVHSITLQKLVEDHASGRHIHFLKLDVEGAEWDILQSTDWHRIRPELIIAESSFPYSNERRDIGWADHMETFGFHEVFFDGVNTYYLREESLHRRAAFNFPVNVLDGVRKFDPYQHYNLKDAENSNLVRSISQEVSRVVEAEGSAVREYLENDLNVSLQTQKDLVARLTSEQGDYFSRLRTVANNLSALSTDGDRMATVGRGANSMEAVIEQLTANLADLVAQRGREAAELLDAKQQAQEALAKALEHQRLAEEARGEAKLLSKRLAAARASRATLLEMTERVMGGLGGVPQPPAYAEPSPVAQEGRPAPVSRPEPRPLTRRVAAARKVPALRRAFRFGNRALVRRADAYRESGNWAEAAVAYARSYGLRPDRPDLCLQMANMLTHLRMFEDAEEAYREALLKSPGDGLVLLHFGHMLELSGRASEARQVYLESAQVMPDHKDVLGGLHRTGGPHDIAEPSKQRK